MTPESASDLDVARQTIKNHFDKIARLYEQGAGIERIGQYVKGWWQWVNAGVDVIVQRAEELWAEKWDVLHGGITHYILRVVIATVTLMYVSRKLHGQLLWNTHRAREDWSLEFINIFKNVPLFPSNLQKATSNRPNCSHLGKKWWLVGKDTVYKG